MHFYEFSLLWSIEFYSVNLRHMYNLKYNQATIGDYHAFTMRLIQIHHHRTTSNILVKYFYISVHNIIIFNFVAI